MMRTLLEQSLHSRNGFVRKGAAMLLQAPKHVAWRQARPDDYMALPPVLANSFPKSGTHLLDQIVAALPGRRNYGAFLSSMTSSFRFRRRTDESTIDMIRRLAPGEIMRAHLFYADRYRQELDSLRVVHFFIYRDPRDVAVSEAHYYRTLNRWHRLHPAFRDAPSLESAVTLAIRGVERPDLGVYYPDIGKRFAHYEGWIGQPNVCSVKFEELTSDNRIGRLREMIAFALRGGQPAAVIDELTRASLANISPHNSHTFRSGKSNGWRDVFTDEHRAMFKQMAGEALIRQGYEATYDW
jgi:hypothetical protein